MKFEAAFKLLVRTQLISWADGSLGLRWSKVCSKEIVESEDDDGINDGGDIQDIKQ